MNQKRFEVLRYCILLLTLFLSLSLWSCNPKPILISDLDMINQYANLRQFDDAEMLIKKKLEERPNDHQLLSRLGWVSLKQDKLDNAIDIYCSLIQSKDYNSYTFYYLGLCLLKKGEFFNAKKNFKRAILGTMDSKFQPICYEKHGDCLMELHKYSEARDSYQKASEINPELEGLGQKLANAEKNIVASSILMLKFHRN